MAGWHVVECDEEKSSGREGGMHVKLILEKQKGL